MVLKPSVLSDRISLSGSRRSVNTLALFKPELPGAPKSNDCSMTTLPRYYALPPQDLLRFASPIRETLASTAYSPPEGSSVSIKYLLESLLPRPENDGDDDLRPDIRNFCLCCAAMASAEGVESPSVYWIPRNLSAIARSAIKEVALTVGFGSEKEMVEELMQEVVPMLKKVIKESCVDPEEEEFIAASAKSPVAHAIVAAHQFRWLVSQVGYPQLGKLSSLVIPCGLTALDHWSPEVKEQGMIVFIHLGKNVTAAELSWYEEAIFDVCCRNIASSDELWHIAVEMSVLMLTCTQQRNPRSAWSEQILNEMLGHLERQPMNKERRIAWLLQIEPVFNALGLVILVHFRRVFSLFFEWMHIDDEKTILLVLERLNTVIKLTWVRKSPFFERLVDELILLYKEVAFRTNREVLRRRILETLMLLQKCKGQQFDKAWGKHKNDPDLVMLTTSFPSQQDEVLQ